MPLGRRRLLPLETRRRRPSPPPASSTARVRPLHPASSFGRKVARSRSVGCGSRSFSGDFLERISTGFGDCALRRVESHREPKPKAGALGHLGGAHDDGDGDDEEYEYAQHHQIKCAGFFGGLGAAPAPPSSYGSTRVPGARSHRSWAWALASPVRALRPTSSTSKKTIMAAPHNRAVGNNGNGNMPTMTAFFSHCNNILMYYKFSIRHLSPSMLFAVGNVPKQGFTFIFFPPSCHNESNGKSGRDGLSDCRLMDLKNGTELVLTYEDKD